MTKLSLAARRRHRRAAAGRRCARCRTGRAGGARAIVQSAEPVRGPKPRRDAFEVALLAHLRPVKDPFRAAMAARLLPARSRVRVLHAGAALDPDLDQRARSEEAEQPALPLAGRDAALARRPRPHALAAGSSSPRARKGAPTSSRRRSPPGVPVAVARGSPGRRASSARDYPGLFAVGDTHGLAALLERAETDAEFRGALTSWCRRLAPLVEPARERKAWRDLLRDCARPAAAATRARRPAPRPGVIREA